MIEELKKLQSGTDIRGVAIEYDNLRCNLTIDKVRAIGYGFAAWIKTNRPDKEEKVKISVGMDSRLSGPSLKTALIEVLKQSGCEVYDCGMCTTPAMFMTTIVEPYKCDGAIMITASHLPYYYNGLKFFTSNGGCEKEDISNILKLAADVEITVPNRGKVKTINFIDKYAETLVNKIREGVAFNTEIKEEKPLVGSKIIVDAGNGAGGFFVSKVLESLGAVTEGSQFIDPDGRFPNHIPNPEDKEAMNSLSRAVLRHKADLGIIFDADVDRAAIVSKDGKEVNKNALIALISSIMLEEHPKSYIVTDSVTSTGLSKFIANLGGVHHRFKRGYKNVINEAKHLNIEGKECHLAIETSGHAALKENYFLDDGAYLIAKVLIKMAKLRKEGKEISYLINDLKEPKESSDIRLKIKTEDFRAYGEKIISELRECIKDLPGWSIEPVNYEGIRVNCDKANGDGWFLLRLSLHEPVLPLNIESDSEGGINIILDRLKSFLQEYPHLDCTDMKIKEMI